MPKLITPMRLFFATGLFILSITLSAQAQYYYKDILSNRQLMEDMSLYKKRNIHKITVNSFEDDGTPSRGFFCKKTLSRDFRKVEIGTRTADSKPSLFTSLFNEDGTLSSTYDSSETNVKSIKYTYDGNSRISSIRSVLTSKDDDFITQLMEEHVYSYNAQGHPEKMLLIRNQKDSTLILFTSDDKNPVTLEKNSRTGRKYYYYYDSLNRITDIVKESEINGKLLPDYILAYDDNNQLAKMMSTEDGSTNYYIWAYEYDTNGLRKEERIYSKEKRLLGSLKYSYQ